MFNMHFRHKSESKLQGQFLEKKWMKLLADESWQTCVQMCNKICVLEKPKRKSSWEGSSSNRNEDEMSDWQKGSKWRSQMFIKMKYNESNTFSLQISNIDLIRHSLLNVLQND